MLVFFINAMLACIWEMVLLFVTGPWLMGPTIPSVADYMVCQTMHVNYSYTGTPLDLPTVSACCLQALSGAEDSFVPALGHSVLLLCQSPVGTLLTPSCNCLHVAKSKTPKTGEPRSCSVGFCLFFFFWSVFSFCPQSVKCTALYQFNTVRKVRAHEGGQREEKGQGRGRLGAVRVHPWAQGLQWLTDMATLRHGEPLQHFQLERSFIVVKWFSDLKKQPEAFSGDCWRGKVI